MASSTRSSLTPRARSWESTMRNRKFENGVVSPEEVMRSLGNLPVRIILFLWLSNADVEADHTVLISRAHHRNVAIDVVFALNDLLRTLGHVRAVSKRNVIGELLLDGDLWAPRCGVGFRGQPLWIDLDAADSKQLLHATAHDELIAWLMIRLVASSVNASWPDCSCNCSDSSLVRPSASSAMMSDLGRGGSER